MPNATPIAVTRAVSAGAISAQAVAAALQCPATKVGNMLAALEERGMVRLTNDGWIVTERGSASLADRS